jgi:ATP-dependent helicase HrpB
VSPRIRHPRAAAGPAAPLPIEPALPDIGDALATRPNLVLQAPPGAGKTTLVPLALLDAPWLAGRSIVMLEPRRIAARMAAARMAALLGEEVGQTVGYRIRLEARVSAATRIEVVTEGILTRRVQSDPELEGVGLVIFDEFHERSLNADLGLALCREAQAALRPELRLLVMSATLDAAPVARLLGGAPVITSEGRSHPVATRHLGSPPRAALAPAVASAVRRALAESEGDILAFLPGEGEIRRTEAALRDGGLDEAVLLAPLYGALPQAQQERAIRPAEPGRRKVVLATSVAETSLTIEGVHAVVDSGLSRLPRFDPRTGMSRLETVRVSRATAEQRRGRAGRLGPGTCWRLWSEAEERTLLPFHPPEILAADLAPLALELALWGVAEPTALAWLDPPPAAAYAQARDLLRRLGALDAAGALTAHGRRMAALATHPRLAHMLLKAQALGLGAAACDLAAVLADRDIVRAAPGARDTDLRLRLELMQGGARGAPHLPVDRAALTAARDQARRWRRQLAIAPGSGASGDAGLLTALAYPDRIAQRRGAGGLYRLSSGRGAGLPDGDPLSASDWLGVAALDAGAENARVFLAAPLRLAEIEAAFADAIEDHASVRWDEREGAVAARMQRRLGALVLSDAALTSPPPHQVGAAMLEGVRQLGLTALPWTPELRQWQARVQLLRRLDGAEAWPDMADEALLARLDQWLAPYLAGITRRSQLARVDLYQALAAQLDWRQQRRLEAEAPTHLVVPSGSRLRLDYTAGSTPVLAVRLQEMFGATQTPHVAGGRIPVLIHLLSPAGRPVQVTQDLASFWATGYAEVRRDLRGRYPKHHWPDDPPAAPPTARARRRERT